MNELEKETWDKFHKIGFGNQAIIVGTKRVELLDFIHERTRLAYERGREDEAKAFGGCKKCYGKGYSTSLTFTEGAEDFGGEGFRVKNNPIHPCTCDRGKQIASILAAREE